MGGGDLNLKKSWHPSTLRNIERVWKAEQMRDQERAKIEQLQKELEEERSKQEMRQYAENKGVVKKRQERLDWMYQGVAGLVDRDQYLLGRKVDKNFEMLKKEEDGVKEENPDQQPGALFTVATTSATVDLENKIREDPLFAIKKQEMKTKKTLLSNPVKMKHLRDMIERSLEKKKKKKKKRKKERKSSTSSSDSSPKRKHKKHHSEARTRRAERSDEEVEEKRPKPINMPHGFGLLPFPPQLSTFKGLPYLHEYNATMNIKRGQVLMPSRRKRNIITIITAKAASIARTRGHSRSEKSMEIEEISVYVLTALIPTARHQAEAPTHKHQTTLEQKLKNAQAEKILLNPIHNHTSYSWSLRINKHLVLHDCINAVARASCRFREQATFAAAVLGVQGFRKCEHYASKYGMSHISSINHHKRLQIGKYFVRGKQPAERPRQEKPARPIQRQEKPQSPPHRHRRRPLSEREKEEARRQMMDNAQWRDEQRKTIISQCDRNEAKKGSGHGFLRPLLSQAADTGSVHGRIKQKMNRVQRGSDAMDTHFTRK
ncbi:unnamed protein product [Ixodes pacificus]